MAHDADIFISELDPSAHAARERELLPQLAPEEQARYRAFSALARRRSWLAGRELLLKALTRTLGAVDATALLTDATGGVRHARGEVFLNLSHSGDLLAAAVAKVPVGVDIERLRPRAVTAQAARMFCATEMPHFEAQSDPLLAFYRLWTLKEAACKAAGLTVWDALRHVCFDLDASRCRLSAPFPPGPWRFMHAGLEPDWRLALAWRGDGDISRVSCWRHRGGGWVEQPLQHVAFVAGD